MAEMGRPTKYTQDIADRICAGIAACKPLVKICQEDDMPEPQTVYRWLREKEDFCSNYARAREDQADAMADDLLAVADNPELDANDKRIRVDARKWLSSKFKPKRYGDKLDLGNSDGQAFKIEIVK